ncbi:SGNH hydrolase [Lindgomyces ingoldianus]|uniref:SGNH hydrolase n=1 Tax=Lindgomyces ingoldianus TaxID=673940 RepID=A0ACB6R6H2_9PLEO|nr:SGNH hydrolase [Lindgomyces ingoldianus]KAF2473915.1 SGNH hydrolase [Lindgomyces ingoldianus]
MSDSTELPEIVLFGDSLTQWGFDENTRGFGWVLENKYEGKAIVLNEGVAGYTSTWLKPRFREIIERATESTASPTLLITIFLGANDACLPPAGAHVPLPKFEDNIRDYVETILDEEGLENTKIVLITPPPINIPDPNPDEIDIGPAASAAEEYDAKKSRGYRTYMSKKQYGDKIMEIAAFYEETGRVAGLNYWKALIDAGLADQNRSGEEDEYHEDRLPGCGLKWAKAFKKGYFTDGLHLDGLAYDVLSKELLDLVLTKWPELAPEKVEL